MVRSDLARHGEAWRPRSNIWTGVRLTCLLLAGLAIAILVTKLLDGGTSNILSSPRPLVSVSRPLESSGPQAEWPSALTADMPRTNPGSEFGIDAALADLERALQAAPDEDLDLIVAARLPEIVQRSARKAARFIELQPSSKQREALVRHFSRLWGENDAEGAFAWAQSLPDTQESVLASRAVCLSLSRTNPSAAVERCGDFSDDPMGDAAFQGIFQAWVQSDVSAASEWLAAQPASPRLDRLRQRHVLVLAKASPLAALGVVQQGFAAQADKDEAVITVLHQWGLQDPIAARDWVHNSAPQELKARALAEIDGIENYGASQ